MKPANGSEEMLAGAPNPYKRGCLGAPPSSSFPREFSGAERRLRDQRDAPGVSHDLKSRDNRRALFTILKLGTHPIRPSKNPVSLVLMKFFLAGCLALLVLLGCGESQTSSERNAPSVDTSPAHTFMRALESGREIVFVDSAEAGPRSDAASFELRFTKDSRLNMEQFGYGIDIVPGMYSIHDNEVTLSFDERRDQPWPNMTLSIEGDQFLLSRNDGLRSFKEHWNVWPEAVERIFPLRAKIPH